MAKLTNNGPHTAHRKTQHDTKRTRKGSPRIIRTTHKGSSHSTSRAARHKGNSPEKKPAEITPHIRQHCPCAAGQHGSAGCAQKRGMLPERGASGVPHGMLQAHVLPLRATTQVAAVLALYFSSWGAPGAFQGAGPACPRAPIPQHI